MRLINYYYKTNKAPIRAVMCTLVLLLVISVANIGLINYASTSGIYAVAEKAKILKYLLIVMTIIENSLIMGIGFTLVANIVSNNRGLKRKILIKHYGKVAYLKYIIILVVAYSFMLDFILAIGGFNNLVRHSNISDGIIYNIGDYWMYFKMYFIDSFLSLDVIFIVFVIISINIKEVFRNSKYKYLSLKMRVLQVIKMLIRYVFLAGILFVTVMAFSFISPIYSDVSIFISTNYRNGTGLGFVLLLILLIVLVLDFVKKFLDEVFV